MTNKPMLSVERKLIERAVQAIINTSQMQPALNELRALLDADKVNSREMGLMQYVDAHPIKSAKTDLVECDACPTSGGCVSVCMKAPKTAAQHQGEPVAWVIGTADGNGADYYPGKGLDTLEIGAKLYAEQTAPVSVAHTMRSVMEITQEASQFYVPGTSNWCGHIANRLNGVKP